jgi:hypothetical protein
VMKCLDSLAITAAKAVGREFKSCKDVLELEANEGH